MTQPRYEIGNLSDHLDWTADEWTELAELWDDLPLDSFMGDRGTYRRRRFATVSYRAGAVEVLEQRPFLQSMEINKLNGGVPRTFEPVDQRLFKSPIVQRALAHFADRTGATAWTVNVHQHRITATWTESGRPTPEGAHRDGVDHVAMILMDRADVAGGVSTIHDLAQAPVTTHCLTRPGDYILLDDRTALHSVSPLEPAEGCAQGRRDMLFFEFAQQEAQA
ncbi:2OG-Fe dioxygenase family protein [Catellatospora bangladeshensis]|uniref:2OG-Fe dioxygenase family protein n=1 Tax=Catellatospora bangladeshensis TaxID=310355 RepID=A0A8J3JPI1_9ACTN|nr:2OG-Fe dioxygenase family protein [Catellatospora bangladeshensis]GIF84368.1 hypothetical protein Cba03nite_57170 [Catellatospora bangladeshensis]